MARKNKTHKGVAARFKVTATGKIFHKRSGRRHLLGSKPAKRMRRLRKSLQVADVDARKLRLMIP